LIRWDELEYGRYYEITYNTGRNAVINSVYTGQAIANDRLEFLTHNKKPYASVGIVPMCDTIKEVKEWYARNPNISENSTNQQAIVLLHKDL
jgi:hypothetical protein